MCVDDCTFASELVRIEVINNQRGVVVVIHQTWQEGPTIKKVKCVHTDAKKYMVDRALTAGKTYDVKNETEEFLFVVDNTGKVGGYYKEYFESI
jgi:hypothetical protein